MNTIANTANTAAISTSATATAPATVHGDATAMTMVRKQMYVDDTYEHTFSIPVSGPILNMTQHQATPAQVDAGVVEPDAETKAAIAALLNFKTPAESRRESQWDRAAKLANIAWAWAEAQGLPWATVMVGGAPFFMPALERELNGRGHRPVYAFSERKSVDVHQPDGSVRKEGVFLHVGWADPYGPQE